MRNEVRKDFRFRLFWFLLDNTLLSFYCAAIPFLKMRQSSRNSIHRTNIAELPRVVISSCTLHPVWLCTTLWTAARQLLCAWGHLHASLLEWAAAPFSRGSSQPRDRGVSCGSRIGRQVLYHWATGEAHVTIYLMPFTVILQCPFDLLPYW